MADEQDRAVFSGDGWWIRAARFGGEHFVQLMVDADTGCAAVVSGGGRDWRQAMRDLEEKIARALVEARERLGIVT